MSTQLPSFNIGPEAWLEHLPRVICVAARFNEIVTGPLYNEAVVAWQEQVKVSDLPTLWVPGVVEIPVMVQALLVNGDYEAVLCLGAVVRGETSHFDYVCQQVSYGCQKVALEQQVPVIFGVLTTDNQEQALARVTQGSRLILTTLEMVYKMRKMHVSS